MAIHNYTKDEFGKRLASVVNAASPIRSIQHLKGREQQLQDIERALYAVGRHIFIFGDRGVGKSSLAATAAFQYQSSDAEPIFVSGSRTKHSIQLLQTLRFARSEGLKPRRAKAKSRCR